MSIGKKTLLIEYTTTFFVGFEISKNTSEKRGRRFLAFLRKKHFRVDDDGFSTMVGMYLGWP